MKPPCWRSSGAPPGWGSSRLALTDGVASVVLEFPGHRGTVSAKVVGNVYLAPIPRSVLAPARVLWLAADGGVLRTTRVP
jgi:hypothetical protein